MGKIGQNFTFSVLRSRLAWKKYAGSGSSDGGDGFTKFELGEAKQNTFFFLLTKQEKNP